MKKKLFTLLTLALAVCSGAWADTAINFSGTVSDVNCPDGGLTVTGGTMFWSGLQGGTNLVTANNVNYYKLGSGSAYVQLVLADGKFKAGDVVTATVCSSADNKDLQLSLKSDSGNKFEKKKASNKATPLDLTYTLTASDIENDGSIKIFRAGNTSVRVATFAVTGTRSDVVLIPANLSLTSDASVKLSIGGTSAISTTTDSNADVTYTSGDNAVATVSTDGVITAVGSGITTITVAQAENETYEEAAVAIEVIVPYAANLESTQFTVGSNKYGFSDSNNVFYFTNGLEVSNNGGKTYGSGSLSGTMKYSANVVYTIIIPEGVTMVSATVTARSNYGSDKETANWGKIFGEDLTSENLPYSNEEAVEKTFTFDGGATGTLTVQFGGNQVLAQIVFKAAKSITITPANNKSTYVTKTALDFSAVDGLKAYVATAAAAGKVTLEEVGAVPAGTPLMLIGTANTEYTVPVTATATAPATNMFFAGDGTTVFDGSTFDYILYSDGLFYQIGSGTVATTKAYLHCNTDPTTSGSRALAISFGNETTGISNVNANVKENSYYDLQGRSVAQPQKGLYIVNGKKVIIK